MGQLGKEVAPFVRTTAAVVSRSCLSHRAPMLPSLPRRCPGDAGLCMAAARAARRLPPLPTGPDPMHQHINTSLPAAAAARPLTRASHAPCN